MGLPVKELEIPEKTVYTYEDYRILPEGAPCQLIGGKLIMTPTPRAETKRLIRSPARMQIKI